MINIEKLASALSGSAIDPPYLPNVKGQAMAMVTRYRIEDLVGGYWTGAEFTRNLDWAEEYLDEDEACADAETCDGAVVKYQRYSRYGDMPNLHYHFSQAAE